MPTSLFSKELEWSCHVCGDLRPDAKISVHKNPVDIRGMVITQNIRYCNDREACIEGVKTVSFIRVENA